MAEDDHAKYRPDDDDGDDEGETGRTETGKGSSHDERTNGEYVHRPAVDLTEFDAEEPADVDGTGTVDRDLEGPDGSASDDASEADEGNADPAPEDQEWTGAAAHTAGVETPIPRNLMASIVAVFAILGGGMALLGLLFAGLDLVVLGEPFRTEISLLSPTALLTAIPAQAGVIAVIAGFYAGTREEGTEATVAAATGTFLGVVVEIILVALFVSSSTNLPLQVDSLVVSAVFLGAFMGAIAAGCAVLYDRYITHPDGLLGRLSDRLAAEDQGNVPSQSRK